MVVTKMKQAKIRCRECDILEKKIRGYKTIHTFTKRIEGKTNDSNNDNNISINNIIIMITIVIIIIKQKVNSL